mgnify:CR=1 FL=1
MYADVVMEKAAGIELKEGYGIREQLDEILQKFKINIDKMDTELINAPISGSPIFKLNAILKIPKNQEFSNLAFMGDMYFEKPLGKSKAKKSIIPYINGITYNCLLYTSPSPRDGLLSRMPSSA